MQKTSDAKKQRLWKTDELEKCPFCGGKAKPSIAFMHVKEYRPSEQKYAKKYRVQVICNRCHSRGKPVSFYSTSWGDWVNVPYLTQKKNVAPWVNLAIDYWNRRNNDERVD